MELISVIIPTYNRGTLIVNSIESVLGQTYKNVECIIVDDGSTDNTENIVSEIGDRRIRYFKLKKNSGACVARNFGAEKASGEYIAFQDSDDLWSNTKLDEQIAYLKENNADMVICRLKTESNEHCKFWLLPSKKFHTVNITRQIAVSDFLGSTQTFLLKKRCFEKIRFDEKLPRYQDYDFLIQAATYFKVIFLDKTLATRRVGSDSISLNHNKGIYGCEYLLKKYEKDYRECNRMRSRLYSFEAFYLYQLGLDATEMFKKSIKIYPFSIKNDIKFVLYKIGLWKYLYPISGK